MNKQKHDIIRIQRLNPTKSRISMNENDYELMKQTIKLAYRFCEDKIWESGQLMQHFRDCQKKGII